MTVHYIDSINELIGKHENFENILATFSAHTKAHTKAWSIKLNGKILAEKLGNIENDLELVGKGLFIKNKETVELSTHYDSSDQMVRFCIQRIIKD